MQPILTVDLNNSVFGQITIPTEWENQYLGGASLAARMLYDQLLPDIEPLSPESPLLFLCGPLTGTSGPAVGRFVVCGRSPATRLWAESNCGGFWGPELRRCGFDGVLITGQAPEPVYLLIQDGKAEIRLATLFWGLETYASQEAIKMEVGVPGCRVATIGPAGEAGLPFASILCDHGRMAGRTGMGAVMGAKNLKAIAVQGKQEIPLADPQAYQRLRSEVNRELRNDPVSLVSRQLGTASIADYFDYLHEMPKRYFQFGSFLEELKISGAYIAETILVGRSACHGCVIACGRVVQLEGGIKQKGPEYETLVGFGPNLGLNDPIFVTRMGDLCDRYGMDTISLSNTIGLAIYLYEKGYVTEEDTGGRVLTFGDPVLVEDLVHLTIKREGFGVFLAQGALNLANQYGVPEEAVQVNGLEVAYHDPRGASGMALVYATSPRGACHNQSDYFVVEMGQADSSLSMEILPIKGGAEKSAQVARHQDWRTIFNALVMCTFANVPPDKVVGLVNSATGVSLDLETLLEVGERAWNLKRVINHRLGLRQRDDCLPKNLLVPYVDDPEGAAGFVPDFKNMLSAYYDARGWDHQTGFPTAAKLQSLGLEWTIMDLERL